MNEKQKYYFNRTFKHIQLVQNNALILINNSEKLNLTCEECRELSFNVFGHDRSKFSTIQFDTYLDFSWAKKNKEKLTDELQLRFNVAWKNHYSLENHHMECGAFHVDKIILLEIACDLQAMAEEFGEGSCRKFFEDTWIKRQYKILVDDFKYGQIKIYMERIIDCFENELNKK